MKNTQCTQADAELGPTQWPQLALEKDQSYCSPTRTTTIINPTFTLNTWLREERQDPLSQWSRRTIKWQREATPGQEGVYVLISSIKWVTLSQKPACRELNLLEARATSRVHLLSADLLPGFRALGNLSHWVRKAKSSKKVNPLGDNKLSGSTWSG